mgnify:FL=1|tara:strand:- start:104 stop:355 length:252 start_codon:yes stop_codon:yes gene_type:complete
MFIKIINLLFLLSQTKNIKTMHYRIIKVENELGCVQGLITRKMAEKLNANAGKCSDVNCNIYRGKITLPFCCIITGYSCGELI